MIINIFIVTVLDVVSANAIYEELIKDYPEHFLVYSAYLQVIDPLDKRILPGFKKQNSSVEELNKVLNICNKVLCNINPESLLVFMATKVDLRPDATKIKRQVCVLKTN